MSGPCTYFSQLLELKKELIQEEVYNVSSEQDKNDNQKEASYKNQTLGSIISHKEVHENLLKHYPLHSACMTEGATKTAVDVLSLICKQEVQKIILKAACIQGENKIVTRELVEGTFGRMK